MCQLVKQFKKYEKNMKKYLLFVFVWCIIDIVPNGSLVKGSRRRPLTAETRVRFPYELLGVPIERGFAYWTYVEVTVKVTVIIATVGTRQRRDNLNWLSLFLSNLIINIASCFIKLTFLY